MDTGKKKLIKPILININIITGWKKLKFIDIRGVEEKAKTLRE